MSQQNPTNSAASTKLPPVMLIVLDGWGYRIDSANNAIAAAKKPVFDALWKKYSHTLLNASGLAVGLPEGQMGNSEVGHTTIGAGKIVDTELVRIDKAIHNGEFDKNPAVNALFDHVKKNEGAVLHLMGLVSNGGVHSHQEHLFALLRLAARKKVPKVAVHVFTDGRDTAPQSAATYLKELEKVVAEVGNAMIASISGRFYAMDRDHNYDRLAKAEKAMFVCEGNVCQISPDFKASDYVNNLYKEGKLDEHLEPIVCTDLDGKSCAVQKNDAVFFFNFRADRARQLTEKLLKFQSTENVCLATMTEYSTDFKCLVAFPPSTIETTLAAEISRAGLTQAHIAETEKFPHATYFLNGGREEPYPGERHVMLDSHKDVPTHDLAPKMRAEGIADAAIAEIKRGTDFIFINFANADMVGHTANVPAIIEGVEEVDRQLGRVMEALLAVNGEAFITADHGNAEINIDPVTGVKHTAHTTSPVPAILVSKRHTFANEFRDHDDGRAAALASAAAREGLSDIAPTVLALMGIPQPAPMTGKSILA